MNLQKPLLLQGAEMARPPSPIKIYAGLMLAFALTLLPWTEQYRWLVPDFTLMALLYWNIRAPRLTGLGVAFSLGLITDVARGGLIGINALAYCSATFVVLLVRRRLEGFDAPRQTLQLAPILLGKELLVLTIGLAVGRGVVDWRWLAAGIVATLLWPPLAQLFDHATNQGDLPNAPTTHRQTPF